MKDLTSGNEGSLIVKFAIPMLLGNVFQQLYNTVDSIIVGNVVGKEALAAVGASFPIMFLLLSLIMGVTMGATILISQYFGAKDYEKLKKTLDTTYIFLFFGSIAISILGVLLSGPILRLMNTPQDIVGQAQTYLNIIFAGMLTLFGYNAISAILRGLGDSKTPLYFIIIATLLNIVLDLVFVMTFGWGIAGVAWATIISQGVSFLSGILYLNKNHDFLGIKLKGMRFDGEI
ncbi:MAG TPA: MATE family efflux transporter, partial [Mesotoga infera]|nr:MATE family efflux transporter [Mesotoga infera]